MDRFGRTGLGLLLLVGGVAAFGYCLKELMDIGTCASGGPYVSTRPCPDNTVYYGIGMFPAVIAALIGIGLLATRPGRKTKPGLPPTQEVVTANPVAFGNSAGRQPAEGNQFTDFFAQAQKVQAETMARATGHAVTPPPAPVATNGAATGNAALDTLAALEQLEELRRRRVLTDAEFEEQKARVLRGDN
jgi:hypothetical protein